MAEKTNWGLIIGGVAIVGVAGAIIYYLFTDAAKLQEYLKWILDWEVEYEKFMEEDGHIPVCVGEDADCKCAICGEQHGCFMSWNPEANIMQCMSKLTWKEFYPIRTLQKELEKKGLMGQAIDLLIAFGIVVTIAYSARWFFKNGGPGDKIMESWVKRHPPPGSPEGKPIKNEVDNTYHPTGTELLVDFYDKHESLNDEYLNNQAWGEVQALPEFVLAFLEANVPYFTEAIGGYWDSLEGWQQSAIIMGVAAICVLLLAYSLGLFSPVVGPALSSCLAAII